MGLRNGMHHALLLRLASLLTSAMPCQRLDIQWYGDYKYGWTGDGMHFAILGMGCDLDHNVTFRVFLRSATGFRSRRKGCKDLPCGIAQVGGIYSIQEKDFPKQPTYAAWANAVGRLQSVRIASGILANVSSACSTLVVSASKVGK